MKLANEWKEYKILDMADGQKLEKWGDVVLSRPDPQIIWKSKSFPNKWKEINATYHRSKTGGGSWEYNKKMPSQWQVHYKNLTFNIKPMGFKHTGLFPEQAVNWDWMIDKIKSSKREIKVLNLFAYTGGATVACLSAGASVCHVDSSKGMTTWAKENVEASVSRLHEVVRVIAEHDVVPLRQRLRSRQGFQRSLSEDDALSQCLFLVVFQVARQMDQKVVVLADAPVSISRNNSVHVSLLIPRSEYS